jgi:hypothetical protein
MQTSQTITEISKALVEFNKELSRIEKDANNPFFKNSYATLDTILDTVRPILARHGISILQMPSGNGELIEMRTILLHTSGEFIESPVVAMKAVKNDPQSLGSTITYAKRYSISAMLGISTGDKDDDGNSGSHSAAPSSVQNNGQAYERKASDDQIKLINSKLESLAKKNNTTKEELLKKLNIQSVNNLSSKVASALIQKLLESDK